MRTIESRRFVSGDDELRLSLVEEKGRLPFRIRMKHVCHDLDGDKPAGGLVGAFPDEAAGQKAFEVEAGKTVGLGWVEVPKHVAGLVSAIPAPGRTKAPAAPTCAHSEIADRLRGLSPGKSIVCPECFADVAAS